MRTKKYVVIMGNNLAEQSGVISALEKAGFTMCGRKGLFHEKAEPLFTINESFDGRVGCMCYDFKNRIAQADEILFPADVIRNLKLGILEGVKKPEPVKMTVAQVCAALGHDVEIVKGE